MLYGSHIRALLSKRNRIVIISSVDGTSAHLMVIGITCRYSPMSCEQVTLPPSIACTHTAFTVV